MGEPVSYSGNSTELRFFAFESSYIILAAKLFRPSFFWLSQLIWRISFKFVAISNESFSRLRRMSNFLFHCVKISC